MPRIHPLPHSKIPWYLRPFLWLQKKKWGQELEPSLVWARQPRLLYPFTLFFIALNRKRSPLDPVLRSLVTVTVSHTNHCGFCIDMNSAILLEREGSADKLDHLTNYKESPLFTAKEKTAIAYAEAMTKETDLVSDELFSELRKHFDEDAIVELTGLIAFQICSSKFNAALNIPSQHLCKR